MGSSYGTLSGPINAFSAANRPKDKYKAPGKNFMTTPGKMGTGYGYIHTLYLLILSFPHYWCMHIHCIYPTCNTQRAEGFDEMGVVTLLQICWSDNWPNRQVLY